METEKRFNVFEVGSGRNLIESSAGTEKDIFIALLVHR